VSFSLAFFMKKSVVIKSVFFWIACANSPVPRYMKSYYSIDAGIGWNTLTNAPSQLLDKYDPFVVHPNPGPGTPESTNTTAAKNWPFYSPQWHTMQARNGRSGAVFQGGLSLMHIMKKSRIALGVYSSFGYSNARSSSFVQPAAGFWNRTINQKGDLTVVFPGQPKSFSPISLPELKTTVMASTVIELGIKLGRVTPNEKVLPYIKMGWGLYRLTAQLNSVWTPPDNQYFDSTVDNVGGPINLLVQGQSATGAGTQYDSHIYTSTNKNLSFVDQSSIVSSKKAQWTNSIVVGVGFDYFPRSNISIGLVYQAAFCANVIFDQWNKTVAGGTFIVSQTGKPGGTPDGNKSWYNVGTAMAKKPSIAISPVFQSIILSCKYCWPCHK
jgi:hypothetical protein